jgi:large subunit ribosomal protein L25
LPADIPKSIDLDVTELSFGQVLRVSDLDHGGKMKFLTPEDNVVAHIVAIKEEVVETPDATAAAAIEGAPAEPEVLKKGKQDADAAAPAADAKAKK